MPKKDATTENTAAEIDTQTPDTTGVENNANANNDSGKKSSKRSKKGDGVAPEKYKYVIKSKKAKSEIKQRKIVIIIAIMLALLLVASGLIYGFYSAVNINNFSIYVENSGNRILSLSSTEDFTSGTQVLEITGPATMDNTSLSLSPIGDTPIENNLLGIITGEGQQSTPDDKYIAASFFLRNTTSDVQYYNEFLKMVEYSKNIDSALRVMLVKQNTINVFAKAKADGTPEKVVPTERTDYPVLSLGTNENGETILIKDKENAPWLADSFYGEDYIFYNKGFAIQPGETVKYSIIIWLEGWDPECTNDIIGGLLRIEFAFEQISPTTE